MLSILSVRKLKIIIMINFDDLLINLIRFEKCVSIGMEKSWVMSEEERLQLLKK